MKTQDITTTIRSLLDQLEANAQQHAADISGSQQRILILEDDNTRLRESDDALRQRIAAIEPELLELRARPSDDDLRRQVADLLEASKLDSDTIARMSSEATESALTITSLRETIQLMEDAARVVARTADASQRDDKSEQALASEPPTQPEPPEAI